MSVGVVLFPEAGVLQMEALRSCGKKGHGFYERDEGSHEGQPSWICGTRTLSLIMIYDSNVIDRVCQPGYAVY